jgi:microcystin-dependent protein
MITNTNCANAPMNKHSKASAAVLLASLLALGASAQSVPSLINYQGRLTDQTGAPLAAGLYGIQFKLWDDPLAGNLIWGQQQTVTLQSNGVFNVILGSPGGSPIPNATPAVNNLAYAFGGSNCFLGVTVVVSNEVSLPSASEILPRQQLLSVPFALVASTLVSNLANALCPPGTVVAYMGTNPPAGWLLCNGSTVSRTQYASLFSVIGTASGAGDGSTTFNLPDLRGVFLRGVDAGRGLDPDTGSRTSVYSGGNTGDSVGSYQDEQFKSHNHDNGSFTCGNSTALSPYELYGEASSGGVLSPFASWVGITSFTGWTSTVGGSETRPKNVYVNYIIKY